MAITQNLLDSLQSDLRTISNEAKKKFPPLREAAEAGIIKVRAASSRSNDLCQVLYDDSVRIIEPFIMACEFKQNQKVIQTSLNAVQRLIVNKALSPAAACNFVDCLWTLMENGNEEVKVLQTATLLVSTNTIVSGATLARALVLCFRLHFTKNVVVNSVASATIRQLLSIIYERVDQEDTDSSKSEERTTLCPTDYDELRTYLTGGRSASQHSTGPGAYPQQYGPRSLRPAAQDAFLLLRDLLQLVQAEQPYWLVGITEMTRSFGLELLELIFISYSVVLARHNEFRFLVKEKICPLILTYFSPDIRYSDGRSDEIINNLEKSITRGSTSPSDGSPNNKQQTSQQPLSSSSQQGSEINLPWSVVASIACERPLNPVSMRVLRVMSMLIQKFYRELITECDILMSILIKLIESDSSLKQISGGPLKLTRLSSADTGTAGTTIGTVGSSEIPVLTTMISKLFDNSTQLSDQLLVNLIESLCILSRDSIEGQSQATFNSSGLSDWSKKQENSPFVLAKLLDTGLVNLHRIHVVWKPLAEHFLEVSYHPNSKIREWGADALTHLTRQVFCHMNQAVTGGAGSKLVDASQPPIRPPNDCKLDQRTLLRPLQRLSASEHPDIRKKQLDTVSQIIQSTSVESVLGTAANLTIGHATPQLTNGWPQLVDIIGATDDSQNENLIRIAFQCLQIIVSDHLTLIDSRCIVLIIAAIVRFASQTQDTNVSLTAIGLLWNVADHLFQNRNKISVLLSKNSLFPLPSSPTQSEPQVVKDRDTNQVQQKIDNDGRWSAQDTPNLANIYELLKQHDLSPYDSIWMVLFVKLGEICTDSRPAIRKSACQTLFSTISTHGSLLESRTWQAVLWQVLFPLLNQVRTLSALASDSRVQAISTSSSSGCGGAVGISSTHANHDAASTKEALYDESLNSGEIMMHHSRDTAQKQWSETQVLALTGVTKVFSTKRECLMSINNFSNAWNVLLGFLKTSALSKISEVSLASLKCFQDLLSVAPNNSSSTTSGGDQKHRCYDSAKNDVDQRLWTAAWQLWLKIGTEISQCNGIYDISSSNNNSADQLVANGTIDYQESIFVPSQTYLIAYLQVFSYLYPHISGEDFNAREFEHLCTVINGCLSIPITDQDLAAVYAYQTMPTHGQSFSSNSSVDSQSFGEPPAYTTPLQDVVLDIMANIEKDILVQHANSGMSCASITPAKVSVAPQAAKISVGDPIDRQVEHIEAPNDSQDIQDGDQEHQNQSGLELQAKKDVPEDQVAQEQDIQEQSLLAIYLKQLAKFFTYSFARLKYPAISMEHRPSVSQTSELMMPNFVPFAEKSLKNLVVLYRQYASDPQVIESHVLQSIVIVFQDAPKIKLGPTYLSTWRLAVMSLLNILQVGLAVARQEPQSFANLWPDLAHCLELFLFPNTPATRFVATMDTMPYSNMRKLNTCAGQAHGHHVGTPSNQTNDISLTSGGVPYDTSSLYCSQVQIMDESLDVKIVEFIQDRILPYSSYTPNEFVLQIVSLLNRGSIHSLAVNLSPICVESNNVKLREDFARRCFETLLQFSYFGPPTNPGVFIGETSTADEKNGCLSVGVVNKLAANCLLQRFSEVLVKFNRDESLAGKCPLPRHRMSEITFVLKAMATLFASLKKVPSEVVGQKVWHQVISMYPHLVDCATRNSPVGQVQQSLREVLLEYASLLTVPPIQDSTEYI